MACLRKKQNRDGVSWLIIFYLNKKQRTLFLPQKYTGKEAKSVQSVVEDTVTAIETGATLNPRTYAWLNNMTPDLRARFESAGLVEPETKLTLEELFDRYEEEELPDMKQTTARNKRQAARTFFGVIDKGKDVREFTHSEALTFAAYLANTKSEATKAGYIRDVRRVFNWGVERELVEKNPFDHIPKGSYKNKARERFVTRQEYAAMLESAKSQEVRALIALYRIGGLRNGEALLVTWGDVDFKRKRLLVHSPKTERIKGRDTRLIPLFPELRKELDALRQEIGSYEIGEYVIQNNRTTNMKMVRQTVERAGLKPWDRLIQNLRSSRAIEIYQEYGVIAESEWIGHSETTAKDHYLHLLESDFDRATFEKTAQDAQGLDTSEKSPFGQFGQ